MDLRACDQGRQGDARIGCPFGEREAQPTHIRKESFAATKSGRLSRFGLGAFFVGSGLGLMSPPAFDLDGNSQHIDQFVTARSGRGCACSAGRLRRFATERPTPDVPVGLEPTGLLGARQPPLEVHATSAFPTAQRATGSAALRIRSYRVDRTFIPC